MRLDNHELECAAEAAERWPKGVSCQSYWLCVPLPDEDDLLASFWTPISSAFAEKYG